MRLLLDTHVLLWALANAPELGSRVRDLILDPANTVFVSIASLWEITVKRRVGKLDVEIDRVLHALPPAGIAVLAVEPRHLFVLETLPIHHRDPFDHLLIAQALADDLTFVTEDRRAPLYGVRYATCSNRGSRP